MREDEEILVYTCVVGRYDHLGEAPCSVGDDSTRFLCFSDRPRRVPRGWVALPLASPPRLRSGHDVNRYHKLFPHRVIRDLPRYSIYIDGNLSVSGSFRDLVRQLVEKGAAMGLFFHPRGHDLRDEAKVCVGSGPYRFDRFDRTRVCEQLCAYKADGFDLSRPISTNSVIVRDHASAGLPDVMSLWWSHLFEFTKRDQLSLNYILWKTGLPWAPLERLPGGFDFHYRRHRGAWRHLSEGLQRGWHQHRFRKRGAPGR